jgi:outer membrane lipoprotein-sorting protein
MQRILTFLTLILAGTLVLAACGQEQITAEEIVARMEAARDEMQDVHATVTMSFVTNERNGRLVVETWMKKGESAESDAPHFNKVRALVLEADEPEMVGSEFVSDGETFWLYSPTEQKAITGNASEMKENAPSDPAGMTATLQEMIQEGLDAVDIEVLGEEQIAGQNTWKLKLTPKEDTARELQLADVVEATMWVDEAKALPLKMEVDASDAGQFSIEVNAIETNTGLADDVFSFTPPADVEVVQAEDLIEQMQPQAATLEEARAAVDFEVLAPTTLPGNASLIELRLLGNETVIQNFAGDVVSFSLVQSISDIGDDRLPPLNSTVEEITVRGLPATLITGSGEEQGTLLRWQENGVRIIIAGTLSADEAIAVAESLQ